jgi:glycine betaine/choline ABC-type transport system substrate-binding protein
VDRTKALACLIAAGLAGGCSRPEPITVGSKSSTEQLVLGEIAAQHLESRLRVPVNRRLNLSGTPLAHQSVVQGQIDLYPEYTGTALTDVLGLPPEDDPSVVRERVRQEYERRFRLVWMPPLGFQNGFAIAVRGERASAAHLQTISDAASYTPGWRIGVGYEFLERLDGYRALMRTYRLPVVAPPERVELGLLYQALESGKVDMVAGSETDGRLSTANVTVLRDDQHAFPRYQAAFVVRADALTAHPGMAKALTDLSGKFSESLMRKLNYEVDVRHRPVPEVAREFLRQAGLAR